jgi:hypothetical protein
MSIDEKLERAARWFAIQCDRLRCIKTADGLVRQGDVRVIESAGQKRVCYRTAGGHSFLRATHLAQVQREFAGYPAFVRVSRSAVANLDHASHVAIDPGRRGYLLSFEDLDDTVLVSDEKNDLGQRPYVDAVRLFLDLPTLDHISPYNDEAAALRRRNIRHFDERLEQQSAEFYRAHFSDGSGRFVLTSFVRNVVWQVYDHIRQGGEPLDSNIRDFWYFYVKNVVKLLGMYNPAIDQAGVVNDVLQELVVDDGLFHYRDMGFFDEGSHRRSCGDKTPRIVLFAEKDGQFPEIDRVGRQTGVTVVAFGGSPNAITTDYLVLELAERLNLDEQPLRLYGLVDYDPAGIFRIGLPFINQLEALGAQVEHLYFINQPVNYTPEQIDDLKDPVSRTDQNYQDWLRAGYGIRDPLHPRQVYGLIANKMPWAQMRDVFLREAGPYLAP